jgi:LemA protein
MIWILVGLVVAVIVFAAFTVLSYNRMVRSRLLVQEGFSGIDVQLKRRHDLIPNLVEIVKGYSRFEQQVLTELTAIRTSAVRATALPDRERVEGELESLLHRLMVVVEDYPDLKANTQYTKLASELVNVEDDLQKSRRYYNGAVREFNTLIQTLPINIVAALFGFRAEQYFQLDSASERAAPRVSLDQA